MSLRIKEVRKTCRRKAAYSSPETAFVAAIDLMSRRGALGIEPYQCASCSLFHIGHADVYRPARMFAEDCETLVRRFSGASKKEAGVAGRAVVSMYLRIKPRLEGFLGAADSMHKGKALRSLEYFSTVKVQAMRTLHIHQGNARGRQERVVP